jgi:hypothetical protein
MFKGAKIVFDQGASVFDCALRKFRIIPCSLVCFASSLRSPLAMPQGKHAEALIGTVKFFMPKSNLKFTEPFTVLPQPAVE